MKRWPLLAGFLLFVALCVSLAYWALQLLKPAPRAVTAPPPASAPPLDLQAAAGLFGGRASVVVASNYQLKGVVAAGDDHDSVAILSANGKPAQSLRQGAEIAPGTVVKEVHRSYVVVSEGGVPKRVELPETAPKSPPFVNPAAPVRPHPPAASLAPTQSGIRYGAAAAVTQPAAPTPAPPPQQPAGQAVPGHPAPPGH